MDPQQRMLLETVYEAAAGAAHAAPAPAAAPHGGAAMPRGGDTGVFVGASYAEWSLVQQAQGLPQSTYTASGSGLSVLSGARRTNDLPAAPLASASTLCTHHPPQRHDLVHWCLCRPCELCFWLHRPQHGH